MSKESLMAACDAAERALVTDEVFATGDYLHREVNLAGGTIMRNYDDKTKQSTVTIRMGEKVVAKASDLDSARSLVLAVRELLKKVQKD
jgi:hypothetical protein